MIPALLAAAKAPLVPEPFQPLFRPSRYKVFYGGRGGAKSWSFARVLIYLAHTRRLRILCTRELQNSIKDSVHKVLVDQIEDMGLSAYFTVTENSIKGLVSGSEFIFKGIRHNAKEIKSTEGIDICWVAEAQAMTAHSWRILKNTIRKDGSEIWVDFNTDLESDPTYQMFVARTPRNAIVMLVNYDQNPFFPEVLEEERLDDLERINEAKRRGDDAAVEQFQLDYDNTWLGRPRTISEAAVFRSRVIIEDFDTPEGVTFYHGVDWGYSQDPTFAVRMWIDVEKNELNIDMESAGIGVELDDTGALFDKIPTMRAWPIKADNSRPETISYMRRQGFRISAAKKWAGSVEDGVAHLKGFRVIRIHCKNCPKMVLEAALYSFKKDKLTGKILPLIVDAHNHGWDATRYALDDFIASRGGLAIWEKLGK